MMISMKRQKAKKIPKNMVVVGCARGFVGCDEGVDEARSQRCMRRAYSAFI